MLLNGLTTHVIVNPMLLDASGRDAWIAVIAGGILFVPWSLMLGYIMKRSDQKEITVWLAERTHPVLAWALTIPLIALLYCIGATTVVHTAAWTITNYLTETPKVVLALILSGLCAVYASWGIRVIAIMSGILLPIVIALGFFVAISNYPEKNFHFLKPFLEFGWRPVLDGLLYAMGGLVEMIVLIGMQHRLKTKARYGGIALYAVLIVYIMLGPLLGAITEFGPYEASKQMVSPYEQWRLVRLGSYVEHVDFFSIYQWLSGACVRISLAIFLCVDLLRLKTKAKKNQAIALVALSYVALSVFPVNEYTFYLWQYHYYFPISLTVCLALSAAWFSVSWFSRSSKGGSLRSK